MLPAYPGPRTWRSRASSALRAQTRSPRKCSWSVTRACPDGRLLRDRPWGAPVRDEGVQDHYTLDRAKRPFLWTTNAKISSGQAMGNNVGVEWKPRSPDGAISNAVCEAICPHLRATIDDVFRRCAVDVLHRADNARQRKRHLPSRQSALTSTRGTASTATWRGRGRHR
jgi:hypothetical protein